MCSLMYIVGHVCIGFCLFVTVFSEIIISFTSVLVDLYVILLSFQFQHTQKYNSIEHIKISCWNTVKVWEMFYQYNQLLSFVVEPCNCGWKVLGVELGSAR